MLAALTKQVSARAAVIDAAAGALKLTPTDLAKRLAAGDRLDTIAQAQGVALKDVFAAIQKAQQAQGGGGLGFGFGFGFGFGGGKNGVLGPRAHFRPGFGGPPRLWKGKGSPPAPPTQTTQTTP